MEITSPYSTSPRLGKASELGVEETQQSQQKPLGVHSLRLDWQTLEWGKSAGEEEEQGSCWFAVL